MYLFKHHLIMLMLYLIKDALLTYNIIFYIIIIMVYTGLDKNLLKDMSESWDKITQLFSRIFQNSLIFFIQSKKIVFITLDYLPDPDLNSRLTTYTVAFMLASRRSTMLKTGCAK